MNAVAPLEATSYALQPRQGPTTWIETRYGPDGQITRKEVDYGGGFSRVTTIDGDRRVNLTVDEEPDANGGAASWKSYVFVADDDFRFNYIDHEEGDEGWPCEVVTSPDAGASSRQTHDRAEDVPPEQLTLLDPACTQQIAHALCENLKHPTLTEIKDWGALGDA